jgi:uncharacterized membrane protein
MKKSRFRSILTVLALAWVVALAVATLVASRTGLGAAYGFSAAVYGIGSLICHQLPQRSFYFQGVQLPVCARCTGLYAGAAALAAIAPTLDRTLLADAWHRARVLLSAAAIPTALTLLYEWGSGRMPSHWIRFAAGFPLGVVVMVTVLAATVVDSAVEIH